MNKSLLKHSQNINPDKNVQVKANSVSRKDAGFGYDQKDQVPNFDVTMRINNHTRNAVLSLSKVVRDSETANGIISELVDEYVKKMDSVSFSNYQDVFNMFEKKDEISFKLKNNK